MTNRTTTVEVPVEQYEQYVPDDYESETLGIAVSAFDDSVYIKFPRFDRSGTNDFCMSAESIFRATVRVTNRRDVTIKPCLREMNVLREQRDGFPITGNGQDVTTRIFNDRDAVSDEHNALVTEFEQTVGGVQDSDYWKGYKSAASNFADSQYGWIDVLWDAFEHQWDGSVSLLLDAGTWFARDGVVVCSRSNALFPIPEWTTPTGSYVATISDLYDGTCPDCGADKDEHWECVKSPASTRKPNVYKCHECGKKTRGITTG